MPLCVLSIVLYPFGLDYFILKLLNYGLQFFIEIGHFFSSLTFSNINVSYISSTTILLYSLTQLIFLLFQSKLKRISIIFLLLTIISFSTDKAPDIFIDPNKKLIAAIDEQGSLHFNKNNFSQFHKKILLSNNGEKFIAGQKRPKIKQIDCQDNSCILHIKNLDLSINFAKSKNFNCFKSRQLLNFVSVIKDGLDEMNKDLCFINEASRNGHFSTVTIYIDQNTPKFVQTTPLTQNRKWYSFY